MIMNLCIEHYELKLYIVHINDDPELTLTYFTAIIISGWEKLVSVLTLGQYQVSVYMTTGPLVYSSACIMTSIIQVRRQILILPLHPLISSHAPKPN